VTQPPIPQKFAEVLQSIRGHTKKPAPLSDLSASVGPAAEAIIERDRKLAERQAYIDKLKRDEDARAAEGVARAWQMHAEHLRGFPARAVADLATLGDTIRQNERWIRLTGCLSVGGLIGLKGPPGTGKTTTAAALARWFMATKRLHAAYWKADDYVAEFRKDTQGFAAPIGQAAWVKAATERDGLLVLDEFDKVAAFHADTFTAKQAGFWLESILDARYSAANRPTILICNLDDAEWASVIPAPVRDRFKCGGVVFNYTGSSKRGAK